MKIKEIKMITYFIGLRNISDSLLDGLLRVLELVTWLLPRPLPTSPPLLLLEWTETEEGGGADGNCCLVDGIWLFVYEEGGCCCLLLVVVGVVVVVGAVVDGVVVRLSRTDDTFGMGGIDRPGICFTFTLRPISVWFGFISLVHLFLWFSSATVIRCRVASYTSSLACIRILCGRAPRTSRAERCGPHCCCTHSKLPPGPSMSAVDDSEKLNDADPFVPWSDGNDNCYTKITKNKYNVNFIIWFFFHIL